MGFKPAGGISKAKDALTTSRMIKEELGEDWLNNDYFRFGQLALMDIERYSTTTPLAASMRPTRPTGGSVSAGTMNGAFCYQ